MWDCALWMGSRRGLSAFGGAPVGWGALEEVWMWNGGVEVEIDV